MPQIVVPFRVASAKRRLETELRVRIAVAMAEDVLAACREVGPTEVAGGNGGQGAAVQGALGPGPALVVNADLPCVTPDDLRALLAATPPGGIALVEARDGTTNALSLADGRLFEPLYGPGSAARFRALPVETRTVDVVNLVDDVDTLADLHRLRDRVGPRTAALLPVTA